MKNQPTDKSNNPLCLPWRRENNLIETSGNEFWVFIDLEGATSDAGLDMIVRAVNSHAALVAALESCREALHNYRIRGEDCPVSPIIDQADAALKEARG